MTGPEVWVQQAQYIDLRGPQASVLTKSQLLTLFLPVLCWPSFLNSSRIIIGTSVSVPLLEGNTYCQYGKL